MWFSIEEKRLNELSFIKDLFKNQNALLITLFFNIPKAQSICVTRFCPKLSNCWSKTLLNCGCVLTETESS